MNEREALEFVMQEIKEQRRADHEMYLDMRKQTTAMYERFLDRLRELDERDFQRRDPIVQAVQQYESQKIQPQITATKPISTVQTIADIFKQLPVPKSSHLTPTELRVDKYEEEPSKQKRLEDVLPYVVEYLKHADGSEPLRDIQYYVETEMNHNWNNFSGVMGNLMNLDPRIQRSKVRGYYIYKEV